MPTLDLHNHGLTTAISSTTSFLSSLVQRHNASCSYAKSSSGGGIGNTGKPGTCSCTVHCIIVTGSGSHSSDGPVLRSAIDKLLQRRHMTYHITPHSGRGSFTVDANSGHELVYHDEGRRTDSKVVVARSRAAALGQEEWPDLPCTSGGGAGSMKRMSSTASAAARRHDPNACVGTDGRQPLSFVGGGSRSNSRNMGSRQSSTASNSNIGGGGGIPAAQDQRVRRNNQGEQNDEDEEVLDVFPLPREVAADDAVPSHIKQMSASEAAQRRSQAIRERNAFQRAMEQSAEDEANRRQELEGAEAEQMAQALRLSREESLRLEMEMEEGTRSSGTSIEEMDDDEFDRLVEASIREDEERHQRGEDREQEELERALQLSQQMEHNASNGGNIDNDEEDEELQKVLALSKQESRRNSAIGSTDDYEEDDIKRAMEESLAMASEDSAVGLDGISGTGHLDDDEAEMIRQAMELSIRAEEERKMLHGALGDNDTPPQSIPTSRGNQYATEHHERSRDAK